MELIGKKVASSYFFYINETPTYEVRMVRAFFGQDIIIIDLTTSKTVVKIKKRIRLIFNGSTLISFQDRIIQNELEIPFHFNHKILFEYNDKVYSFIYHGNMLNSINEDNIQIGMFQRKRIHFFNNNGIQIILNHNADVLLVLSVLTITELDFFNDSAEINIDGGQASWSKIPFNKNWKPTKD